MTRDATAWTIYLVAFAVTLFLLINRIIPLAVSIPLWLAVVVTGVVYFGRKSIAEKRAKGIVRKRRR